MSGKVIILQGSDTKRKAYADAFVEEDPQTRRAEGNVDTAFASAQQGFTVLLNSARIANKDIELLNVDEIDSEVSKEEKK